MFFKVARGLLVIYQVVDGGVRAADGARVAMLHRYGAEQHGLGIEGQQAIGQQLPYPCEVFQRLSSLDGAQHTGNGTQDTRLRTRWYGSYGRRFLEHTTVTGRAWQMRERLSVKAQDATMRERLACHHTRIIDEELHGEVVRAVDDEVVLLDNIERVRRVEELVVGIHLYIGVDGLDFLLGTLYLWHAHVLGEVDDLSLQVA